VQTEAAEEVAGAQYIKLMKWLLRKWLRLVRKWLRLLRR
jgi:hypothetical protein